MKYKITWCINGETILNAHSKGEAKRRILSIEDINLVENSETCVEIQQIKEIKEDTKEV